MVTRHSWLRVVCTLTALFLCPAFTPLHADAATVHLSGTVQGQTGGGNPQPLGGASVEVTDSALTTPVANTTTNPAGDYAFDIPQGTYNVRVTPPIGSQFQPTSQNALELSADMQVNFVLIPAGLVHFSGVLRNASGGTVSGYVSLYNQSDPSQSQENQPTSGGAFSFAVAPGQYRIFLQSGGKANAGLPKHWSMMTGAFNLSADRTQDLTLPEPVNLTVQVTGPEGNGVPAIVETGQVPMRDLDLGGGIHLTDNAQSGDGFEHPTNSNGSLTLPFFPSDQPVPDGGLAIPTEGDYAPTHFDIPVLEKPTLVHISLQPAPTDTTPPALISCESPDAFWHPDNLSFHCHYEDDFSGMLVVALSTNIAEGEESANAIASAGGAQACDASGNCAGTPADIGGAMVDRKPPEISLDAPTEGASYVLGGEVSADYECADGGSGIATCEGTAADGAPLDSTVGEHTFTAASADQVGNTASSMATYSVLYGTGKCIGPPGHTVLPPLKDDGSSKFLKGLPVAVRFRVCDAHGQPVGPPSVVAGSEMPVLVSKTNGPGGPDEVVNSVTGQTGFDWNPLTRVWFFDQSTSNLIPGVTYTYRIDLNDGSSIGYTFSIKKGLF